MDLAAVMAVAATEWQWSFARSSGAGGQNVNKVNTKAILRWNVARSTALPDDVRERFLATYRSRITEEGELVLSSERTRSQIGNREDCVEKLRQMIAAVAERPKVRRRTRPGRAAHERRLRRKVRRSEVKRGRQTRSWE